MPMPIVDRDYCGYFIARDMCYSSTDIQFNCVCCGRKQFVSKASFLGCIKYWDKIPNKGITALCTCKMKATNVDTPDIIKEVIEKNV